MKVGGKVFAPLVYGDREASDIIHAAQAAKRLSKARNQQNWKMAAATTLNRRMLIGSPNSFRPPR